MTTSGLPLPSSAPLARVNNPDSLPLLRADYVTQDSYISPFSDPVWDLPFDHTPTSKHQDALVVGGHGSLLEDNMIPSQQFDNPYATHFSQRANYSIAPSTKSSNNNGVGTDFQLFGPELDDEHQVGVGHGSVGVPLPNPNASHHLSPPSELALPDLIPDSPTSFSPPSHHPLPFATSRTLASAFLDSSRTERSSSVPVPNFPKPARRRTQEWRDQQSLVGSNNLYGTIAPPTVTIDSPLLGMAGGMGTTTTGPMIVPTTTTTGSFYTPSTDHPLSLPEQQDLLDRVRRDLHGVDLDSIKGPLRALALSSAQTTTSYPYRPPQPQPQQPSPSSLDYLRSTLAGKSPYSRDRHEQDEMMRKTVSPQEAFLDYEDVDHRLHPNGHPDGGSLASSLSSSPFVGASLFAPLPRPLAGTTTGIARTPPSLGGGGAFTAPVSRSSSPVPHGGSASLSTSPRHGVGSSSSRRVHPFAVPQNAVSWASSKRTKSETEEDGVRRGGESSSSDDGEEEGEDTDEAIGVGQKAGKGLATVVKREESSDDEEDEEMPTTHHHENDGVIGQFDEDVVLLPSHLPPLPTTTHSHGTRFSPAGSRARSATPSHLSTSGGTSRHHHNRPAPSPLPSRLLPPSHSTTTAPATPSNNTSERPSLHFVSPPPAPTPIAAPQMVPTTSHGGHSMRGSALRALQAMHQVEEVEKEIEREESRELSLDVDDEDGDGEGIKREDSPATTIGKRHHHDSDEEEYVPTPHHAPPTSSLMGGGGGGGRSRRTRKRSRTPAYGSGAAGSPGASSVASVRSEEDEVVDEEEEEEDDDEAFLSDGSSVRGGGATSTGTNKTRERKTTRPNKRRRRAPATSSSSHSTSHTNTSSSGTSSSTQIRCTHISPDGLVCGVIFRRPYDLARHRETIHGEGVGGGKKVEWSCKQCGGTFSRKDALIRHGRISGHKSGV